MRIHANVRNAEVAAARFLERALPRQLSGTTALVITFVMTGGALRLTYYILNPGLSSDEAALALNLINRSFSHLFGELSVNQAAPGGFLVLQKLAIDVFGPSPFALRLLPFVAAIVALVLFYPVTRRLLSRRVALLALGLFAISDPLLMYAATNKQYSVDVVATLALYAVVLALGDRFGGREFVIVTVSGASAVWFSHAAAFVVASIGMVLLVEAASARRSAQLAWISSAIVVWVGSFATAYFLTNASVSHLQRSLVGSQRTLFGEHGHPGILQQFAGTARVLLGIPVFGHGVRVGITLVGLALCVIGVVALCRGQLRVLALLLLPGVIAFIAAAAAKYALFPRAFLFLLPAFVIFAARGTVFLASWNRVHAAVVGIAAFGFLFAIGSYAATDRLISVRQGDPVRVLRFLAQNARSSDSLYVDISAQLDFRYYLECGCFGTSRIVRKARALWPVRGTLSENGPFMSSAPPRLFAGDFAGFAPSDYRSNIAPLRGKSRVWVLVMNPAADAQQALTTYLLEVGRRKELYPRSHRGSAASVVFASVALYDLR
jgi:4-amino-4-deoxy-L-arabinose transferase-like glycosyltransferase